MTEFNEELAGLEIDEHIVLEKFEGDIADGVLVERVTVHNGEIIQHEFIEDGEVVATYDSHQTEGREDLSL